MQNKIYKYIVTSNAVNIQERQTKNGKVYDAVFRITNAQTGKEHQKRLSGYQTKQKAKQAHAKFIKDECQFFEENPFKKTKKEPEKQTPAVKDLIAEYLGSLSNQNDESTVYHKRSVFSLYVIEQLGEYKITDLTKERLYRWQDELWGKEKKSGEHYSYNYLKKVRNFLFHFLNWTYERYGYQNNLAKVKIPPRRETRIKDNPVNFWTEEQFKKFISAVDNPQYKALFSILFYTGKREGEILALSPADYKGDKLIVNKSVTKHALDKSEPWKLTTTKKHKSEILPLSPAAQLTIKEYMKTEYYDPDSDFIFGKTRPLPQTTVTFQFDKYIKLSNVPRITIHGLRHSFVSLLIHHGANLTVVADLINDTLEQVTKTYAHMYNTDKITVLNSITL